MKNKVSILLNLLNRGLFRSTCAALVVATLVGCANLTQPHGTTGDSTFEQLTSGAESALQTGQRERALGLLGEAAKLSPTRQEPWLRTAQIHFDAGNYGQAILAGQEVLQREPTNKTARSIIAVSGLRLSVKALTELRGENVLSSDVRTEAENLTKILRGTLGAAVLIPASTGNTDSADGKLPARNTPAQTSSPRTNPSVTPPTTNPRATRPTGGGSSVTTNPPGTSTPTGHSSGNPFGSLK